MWMKVDDGLHAHRKTRAVTKSHPDKTRDAAPMGLWVLAGSWAAQNGTDGWVPEDELDRWDADWPSLTRRLVRAGYWWPSERDGESGYGFNDWLDYNPESEAASRSGSFGNHIRWHANRGKVDPECEHCPREPDRGESGGDAGAMDLSSVSPSGGAGGLDHDPSEGTGGTYAQSEPSPQVRGGVSGGDIGGRSGGESGSESRSIALPVPDPTPARPDPTPVASAIAERRDDVEQVCEHLANAIEANGSKRPAITTKWRQAARLMLDKDGRSEDEVHGAIEWCQRDEFWRANILSLPTLREKYDTLRLQAQRKTTTGGGSRNAEWREMQERQMQRAVEREREMGLR
jgi:hypothetical protein